METGNAKENQVDGRRVDCDGGTCGGFQDCERRVSALACSGHPSLAWSQYLDSTQPDPFSRWMTPGSRLYTHLAIIAGRHPCAPHVALRSGFTALGWLWREYPMCSASGWMVSRVQYGEAGSIGVCRDERNTERKTKEAQGKAEQLEVF